MPLLQASRAARAARRAARALHAIRPVATVLVALALCIPGAAAAQVSAVGDQSVPIHARKTGGVRIVPLSGDGQTVVVTDGAISTYAQPVLFSIAWNFPPNSTNNLYLVGYFLEANAALRSGSDAIPSSYVEGRMGIASTWAPFSATYNYPTNPPTAGNALHLWTSPSTRTFGRRGAVTLDLYLRLTLTGREVPAGPYSGTLVLQAFTH